MEKTRKAMKNPLKCIHNIFSKTYPIIKKLRHHAEACQPTDADSLWVEKAIKMLERKLRVYPDALSNLAWALEHPDQPSKCVTIERTNDGRVQVLNRKGWPHVIFCQLWRWPDLKSLHELHSDITVCAYPYSKRSQYICINPYHYIRLLEPYINPVMVPRHMALPPGINSHDQLMQQQMAMMISMPKIMPPNITVSECPDDFKYYDNTTNAWASFDSGYQSCSPENRLPTPDLVTGNFWPNNVVASPALPTFYQNHVFAETAMSASNTSKTQITRIDAYQPNQQACKRPLSVIEENPTTSSDEIVERSPKRQQDDLHTITEHVLKEMFGEMKPYDMSKTDNALDAVPVAYEKPDAWALIAYYEQNTRIGEMYECTEPIVTVDCLANPYDTLDRFALVRLEPSNAKSERTKASIGEGIQLHHVRGQLIIENLSVCSVFVQSKCSNCETGVNEATVFKVPTGVSHKIFDSSYFSNVLKNTIQYGYARVYDLVKFCTIRVSFTKGWGTSYNRNDASETPCWLEVHLNGPKQWLDSVVRHMNGPESDIGSVS